MKKSINPKLFIIGVVAVSLNLMFSCAENEAEIVILAKDKILHQRFKGLSKQVVQESFNWDEDYLNTKHPKYKSK